MTINWEIAKEDHDALILVADRTLRELKSYPDDKCALVMDLNACHSNGCPLDFKGLLEAPMQDFSHDIYGIRHHINRKTGKLEYFFLPRYARRCECCGSTLQECNENLQDIWDHNHAEPEPVTELPGGVVFSGGTPAQHDILRRRGEFVARYCKVKGWNIDNLSVNQLLEIRSQQGWKEPL